MRRQFLLCLMMATALIGVTSCNEKADEYDDSGSSSILSFTGPDTAFMGDSITFSFELSSTVVRANQAKVQLFFGETMVSERMMTTPENGKYTGKILIPFMKNVVDGEVTVRLRIQNERFANAVMDRKIQITRPQFSKLTLKDSEGRSLDMMPVAGKPHTYAVTAYFPSEMYAVIETPKYGEHGNAMTFGDVDGKISNGSTTDINFSAALDENYEVTFNTLTYEGTPFVPFAVNGIEFTKVNDTNYKVETNFTKGQTINITGLKLDYPNYWVNPAFFDIIKDTNGKLLRFRGRDGKYRLTVDKGLKYFKVDVMNGNDLADLSKGHDVVWCIGNTGIGQPTYEKNNINWSTGDKVICLAPLGNGIHELVLQAGVSLNTSSIDFKFFFQRGWGSEFTYSTYAVNTSTWFYANNSDGNLKLVKDMTLKSGKYYVITLDISAGANKAKLSSKEVTEFPEVD